MTAERFQQRDRALTVVRRFAGGDVRVETTTELVIFLMAHGAVLPDDIEEATVYRNRFTLGADPFAEFCADDDVTGDRYALVLLYPNAVGMAALIPVP